MGPIQLALTLSFASLQRKYLYFSWFFPDRSKVLAILPKTQQVVGHHSSQTSLTTTIITTITIAINKVFLQKKVKQLLHWHINNAFNFRFCRRLPALSFAGSAISDVIHIYLSALVSGVSDSSDVIDVSAISLLMSAMPVMSFTLFSLPLLELNNLMSSVSLCNVAQSKYTEIEIERMNWMSLSSFSKSSRFGRQTGLSCTLASDSQTSFENLPCRTSKWPCFCILEKPASPKYLGIFPEVHYQNLFFTF